MSMSIEKNLLNCQFVFHDFNDEIGNIVNLVKNLKLKYS